MANKSEKRTEQKKLLFRQGDVLIFTAPENVKKGKEIPRADDGRVILAHGELTNHHHAIASKDATLFDRADDDTALALGERILSTRRKVTLKHEEHAPIDLPKGNYIVRTQVEYDPTTMARRVED